MGDTFGVAPSDMRAVAGTVDGIAKELLNEPMPGCSGDAGDAQLTYALRTVLDDLRGLRGTVVGILNSHATNLRKAADEYEKCDLELKTGFDGLAPLPDSHPSRSSAS